MGTDTGDGGFEIDGKTYTYDVGDPDASGIDPKPNNDGDLTVDNSKKDISKKTKTTLSQYLSDLTSGKTPNDQGPSPGNDFPIDSAFSETNITTDKGVPRNPAETTNSKKFTSTKEADGTTIGSPSDYQPRFKWTQQVNDPTSKLEIRKGKSSDSSIPNGHEILQSVKKDLVPSSISGFQTSVLNNNRFSEAAKQNRPSFTHPRYGEISVGRLATIGTSLSIRASRELNAASPGNNPRSGGSEGNALLPSSNQLGATKVPLGNLLASDILEDLTSTDVEDFTSITSGISEGSWGSLTNVHDRWSGITALGMIALSVVLMAAVIIIFELLGFLISMIQGGNGPTPSKTPEGRYTLGSYTLTPGVVPSAVSIGDLLPPDFAALLGLQPTRFPYGDSLQKGTLLFFGIDPDAGFGGILLGGLESSTQNPGFNAIVARTIIRGSVSIIDAFADIGGNPISVIKGILSIIEVIRSSKVISAMNIFANLGDRYQFDQEIDADVNEVGEKPKTSSIDKAEENAIGASVSKNRLKKSLKLAWASNRAPAQYLLPDSTLTLRVLGGDIGGFHPGIGLQRPNSKTKYKSINITEQTTGARISGDVVQEMENSLEAEYMPFYFHDLRTNEIIAFHAFLTSLTDDYSANWESTDGFGRVDPVHIYKNTQRRIGLSFMVASTSDEDFNEMWVKINKLITLVYPQYTKGRSLSDAEGQNRFIQPFSQMIGASPLIRIRLGDLFRSNYSRFALARLFGADSNSMTLAGTPLKFSGATDQLDKFQSTIRDIYNGIGTENYKFQLAEAALPKQTDEGGVRLPNPLPGGGSADGTGRQNFDVDPADLKFFHFSAKLIEGNKFLVIPSIPLPNELMKWFGLSQSLAIAQYKKMVNEYGDRAPDSRKVVDVGYIAPREHLIISPESMKKIQVKFFGEDTPNSTLLGDFLNSNNNAIVRSFKATQGKGLAGKIDSINFDWYDNIKWEIKPGSRAPQMCKVTIAFSPIHDISPGLDHNGYNRAPVYPVGWMNHGRDDEKNNG